MRWVGSRCFNREDVWMCWDLDGLFLVLLMPGCHKKT